MSDERRCPTCQTVLPAREFWIVHSENELEAGALAYWGPYPTREAAAHSRLSADETYPIVEVPVSPADTTEGTA